MWMLQEDWQKPTTAPAASAQKALSFPSSSHQPGQVTRPRLESRVENLSMEKSCQGKEGRRKEKFQGK